MKRVAPSIPFAGSRRAGFPEQTKQPRPGEKANEAMTGVNDRARQMVLKTRRLDENHVCPSVQDADVRIEPDGINKLFESLYTIKTDGMGIGLSVSRFIIQNHQGRVRVTRNTGHGSTYCFAIPCRTDSAEFERAPGLADIRIGQNFGEGEIDRVMRKL